MSCCSSPAPLPTYVGSDWVLEVLTGNPSSGDIRPGGSLLYLCSGGAEFTRQMPHFDEWGLHPVGLVGPCENPIAVAPFLVANTDLFSGGGAGRQASLEAGGSGVEMPMSHGSPKATSSGACIARPKVVVDEGAQPVAPEAGAPGSSAGYQEAVPDHSSQLGTPEASCLGASSSAPRASPHVESLGRFRIDFDALRKRKESSSDSERPCRPLKHRKYFAVDE